MREKTVKLVLVFLMAGVVLSSCNKKNKTYDTSYSKDQAYVENIFNNVSGIADEAYELSSNRTSLELANSYYLSECVNVILDLGSNPYLLTIDFGDTNCMCNDGKYRKGKILVSFTGMYREPGTVITLSLDNYFVNNDEVTGTKVVTNVGLNGQDHMQYDVNVNGKVHKANNGGTINWISDRIHEWIEGRASYEISDDVYLISGTASGESISNVSEDGATSIMNSWEIIVTKPLRVALNCKWINSGTLSLNANGWDEAIIEYGSGDCDNEIFVIYNGKTYTVKLP